MTPRGESCAARPPLVHRTYEKRAQKVQRLHILPRARIVARVENAVDNGLVPRRLRRAVALQDSPRHVLVVYKAMTCATMLEGEKNPKRHAPICISLKSAGLLTR